MAAGLGFKDFVTGEVLTAADVDGYLMQGIWVFANAAARDAAVTSPQEGNSCYLKDTDVIQVYSGSAWVTKSAAAGGSTGLTLVKSQAVGSGVSSVEVTSAFSSTYKNYMISLSGVVGSTRGELPMILGTTTSGYYYGGTYVYYNSSTVTGANGNNAAAINNAGMINTTSSNLMVDLQGPFLSAETTFFWRSVQLDSSTPLYAWQAQGFLNNSTSYTSFKLTPSSGTITGGTIYVYGYNV